MVRIFQHCYEQIELLNWAANYDELVNLKFVNKAEIGLTCAAYKHSEDIM